MVTIQRYARRTADNHPLLEVSRWEAAADGDPLAVALDQWGFDGWWRARSISGALADLSGMFTPAEHDPLTGVVVDPGGQPTSEQGLSILFDLPLRDGLVLIDRDEFAALWPPQPPATPGPAG